MKNENLSLIEIALALYSTLLTVEHIPLLQDEEKGVRRLKFSFDYNS